MAVDLDVPSSPGGYSDGDACPVCDGSRFLLSDSCPLCGDDGVPEEQQPGTYVCEICGKSLQSAVSLAEHKLGRQHLNCEGVSTVGAKPGARLVAESRLAAAQLPLSEESLFEALAEGEFRHIVVCTGAGVSTTAGIADFRSPGGLFAELSSKFGARFPEVVQSPEILLSRAFVRQHPEFWEEEMEPWLRGWKCATAEPTATHHFCAWLHRRGWLKRVYTQNVDGLHSRPKLGLPEEKVMECHGALRDGSMVMYGDSLPQRFWQQCAEDFPANPSPDSRTDLVLVFGTSLQVAPFCALPNMVPKGCTRALVNRPLSDCMSNSFSPQQRSLDADHSCDLAQGFRRAPAETVKIGKRPVQLRPLWHDRDANKRWRQLVVESTCDDFVRRFFASPGARVAQMVLDG